MATAPSRVFKSFLKAKNLNTKGPVSVTAATLTLDESTHNGRWVLLDASGGVAVALPAATGSGATYKLMVSTASNATVISTTSAGTFFGGYVSNDIGDSSAGLADFMPAAAGNNTLSPTTAGGGGLKGDWFQFVDVDVDEWLVSGATTGATDPTNRFSTT